ncbi:MAG TPA: DNRLRE domain-containing protein, partial [Gammaproteobacteria bacterium]|nr:DNRLRE domain-containing protein [Gammaproteobacteria bacterium]
MTTSGDVTMPVGKTANCRSLAGNFVAATLLAFTSMAGWSATTTISPDADTTLAQELPDNSSGACDSIFAGTTDNGVGTSRRALLRFDLSSIPPGSIINNVTLSMAVTRGSNHVDSTFTLHPVTSAWVEGTAGCGTRGGGQGEPTAGGGTTWNTMPGFGATASDSTLVNTTSPVWSSAGMASDVQGWLDSPATNNGWILIGDETLKTTTRRFDSREGGSPPSLLVDFTPTGAVEACCETDGSCSLTVVGSGTCGGSTLTGVTSCDPNQCPQPSGACCNADNSCSDNVDKLICESAGGTFAGGNCNQADCGLAPFLEALPVPPVLQPTGTRGDGVPQYTVTVQEATQSVHPDLPDTTVWTYNGSWPASTIVATKGQPIEVTYVNNLPTGGGSRGSTLLEIDTCSHGPNDWGKSKRVVTHLHGGHVPSRVDGQPEYTILPGETDIYEYPNNQDAATVWYHDHALGITRLNVYGGMAGFYLLADSEDTLGPGNAFGLPSGPYEIGLAVQDRSFNADGSLFYNAQLEDAFKGDYAVVNGKITPYLNVDQGKYRFRLLNGSQSREYSLRLENITQPGNDPDFTLVGTDLGLLDAPVNLGNAFGGLQAPAERMDVVIDFSGFPTGTEIILRNDEQTPPLLPSIMKFIVTGNPGYTGTIASALRPVPPMAESSADGTRYFRLAKKTVPCSNDPGRTVNEWLVQSLDGPGGAVTAEHWDDLYEFPVLGTREIWEFENPTNSMHPMHVHLVRFQILDKTDLTTGQPIPLEPWELYTWKDIVRIPANTKARIIMDFEDYLGRFPQHCHLLDHED